MSLFFCVKNFAKIEEAKIDISNFTIFVGNNNSGKTKLMELIYGVLREICTLCPNSVVTFVENRAEIRKHEIELIIEYVNGYLRKNKKEIINSIFNQYIPIEDMYIELEGDDYWYEVHLISEDNVEVLLNINELDKQEVQKFVQQINSMNRILIVERRVVDNSFVNRWISDVTVKIPLEILYPIIMGQVLQLVLGLETQLGQNLFYMPASRMGLMLLYREYFGAKSDDKMELIRMKNQQSQQLTKPVLDFLSFLLQYSYNENSLKNNIETIEFINRNLLDGKLNEQGEITTYTPKGENVEIPLFLSSSMINELDPIMKMLTDTKKYTFLFYDEVETSLHPTKQVELVKLLNRLNNKGIRILLTTHSEAFVNKMNNLLLIARLNSSNSKPLSLYKDKIEITNEDLLESENIHVYQFINKSDGKSTVQELIFRKVPNTGYTFSLFDESANALYEESKIALGIEEC